MVLGKIMDDYARVAKQSFLGSEVVLPPPPFFRDAVEMTCEKKSIEYKDKKILVEIPKAVIEESRIWASNINPKRARYLLFTEKISDNIKMDGYTRISKGHDYMSYDVEEVRKLVKAGRVPVLMLQTCIGPIRISPRDVMTWWITDHVLGFPLNHSLLSVDKGNIEFEVFNLRECFFCEKKSEPLKNLKLKW